MAVGHLAEAVRDRGPIAPPPVELYLEVTNRCNLRCRTCVQFFGMPEPPADMPLERAADLLAQLGQVRRVVLHGIGESLLHPQLADFVRLAHRYGARAVLNSNGTALRGRRLAGLLEAGLDELRVSVDAGRAETYARVRGASAWDRVWANLEALARLKRRMRAQRPVVSVWMTAVRTNLHEIEDLVERAANTGGAVQQVYVQRLVTSQRGLARQADSLHGDPDAIQLVRRAAARARRLGIALRGSGVLDGDPAVALTPSAHPAPWRGCFRPWRLLYVTAHGTALPCCIAPFTSMPFEEMVLGDVFRKPVEAVWNGPRYRHWRARMLGAPPAPGTSQSSESPPTTPAVEPPQACASCGVCWSL